MLTDEQRAEADAIIARMTQAQRDDVLNAQDARFNRHDHPVFTVKFSGVWPAPIAEFLSFRVDTLTPLGLRVRARLQEIANADA